MSLARLGRVVGTARILSATVRRDGGRWHVAFTCEVDRAERTPARPGVVVGVDVGVRHLAVLSTGELVPNPRLLVGAQRRLRRLGRRLSRRVGPDRRTRQRPSNQWEQARRQVTRTHARVANLRRDGLHKLTTRLAATSRVRRGPSHRKAGHPLTRSPKHHERKRRAAIVTQDAGGALTLDPPRARPAGPPTRGRWA